MRSPARAIGWEFRRRHRWGLIAVAGYLCVVATIRFLILEPGEPVLVDSVRFVAVVSVPLTTTFVYLQVAGKTEAEDGQEIHERRRQLRFYRRPGRAPFDVSRPNV